MPRACEYLSLACLTMQKIDVTLILYNLVCHQNKNFLAPRVYTWETLDTSCSRSSSTRKKPLISLSLAGRLMNMSLNKCFIHGACLRAQTVCVKTVW